MKNILIPLELSHSKLENRIISTAISYANLLKAKCWIIHVVAPEPDFVGFEVGPQYIRDTLASEIREEHKSVQKIAELFEENKVACEGLLIQGATKDMIQLEIDKLNIDLLILGNKKHSFFDVFFQGSVTDELVDEVNIPILLIPDHE